MIFNRDAGHTLTGGDTGAEGINGILEQNLTRQLGIRIDKLLQLKGHIVNNVTIDKTEPGYVGLRNSLNKRISLCNQNKADLNLCIHFNCSNGQGKGAEIFTWDGKKIPEAIRILDNLEKVGLENRGVKVGNNLALINGTNDLTMLIEVLFIDNEHDYKILETKGLDVLAKAIVAGILNESFDINKPSQESPTIRTLKNLIQDNERNLDQMRRLLNELE